MFWKKKKYPSPHLGATATVAELWEVEWTGMEVSAGLSFATRRPQWEIFLSEDEANSFKQALEQAFQIIRQDGGTKVTVRKRAT